jgi:hypothetical protein
MSLPALCLAPAETITPGMLTGSSIRTVRHAAQAQKELQALLSTPRDEDDGTYWDGGAAHRIAAHLRSWLRLRGHAYAQQVPAHSELAAP